MAKDQERAKLSAEESLRRMQEFAQRKDRFVAAVRRRAEEGDEGALQKEIARRVAEIRDGKAIGRPIEEVLAELRERYP